MFLLKALRRTTAAGLPVVIENPVGSTRQWRDDFTGETGATRFQHAYGFIPQANGMDNEGLDVFVGPEAEPLEAYIVSQRKGPEFIEPDEHKVMIGFATPEDAKRAYLQHYTDDRFFGDMTRMPMPEFRRRVRLMQALGERADAVLGKSRGLLRRVQGALTDDLRREPWQGSACDLAGHCYVAAEALYHLLGGPASGYTPHVIRHEGTSHWYLRRRDGQVLDPTAGQFATPVPYDRGQGKGFLTREPSKRARTVIRRVRTT